MTFPWSRQTTLTFSFELLALAALLLALAWWSRRAARPERARRFLISSAALGALSAVGIVLAFTVALNLPAPPVPFTAQFVQNPVPPSAEAVAAGRAVFQRSCVVCHGARGLGDGPAALTLNPRPVNLQLHVPQHPDGDIYYWITEGVAGTAMAPWKQALTDSERWSVVHYLRALARGEQ